MYQSLCELWGEETSGTGLYNTKASSILVPTLAAASYVQGISYLIIYKPRIKEYKKAAKLMMAFWCNGRTALEKDFTTQHIWIFPP